MSESPNPRGGRKLGPGSGGADNPSPGKPDPSQQRRRSLMPLLLVLMLVTVVAMMIADGAVPDHTKVPFGQFERWVHLPNDHRYPIKEVVRVGDKEYRGELYPWAEQTLAESGRVIRKFRAEISSEGMARNLGRIDETLIQRLGGKFDTKPEPDGLTVLLISILPWILIFALFALLFFRRMGGPMGQGGIFGFTRSRAKMYNKETVNITFEDVAGIDEAKEEVFELVQFLKNPEKFRRLGGRIPRGVLLVGPPGTGKTLLAKAIAGEAGVPFFSISGSDFVEMFVGVGASRVRDLFRQARENSPCIIFLDEIDAVGRRRGAGLGGGHDEREQTLNSILVEMDGFDSDQGIILIAATNRPDVLDPALLRPGRFDRQITVDLPDVKGREMILGVHVKKVKLAEDVDLKRLARSTPGFSGAELANVVNEAAIIAAMAGKDAVDMVSLDEARDKVKFGRAKKGRVMPEKDLRVTAYHEAGHTVVQHFMPDTDPIYKVTIVPRGMAGGAMMSLPEEDRNYVSEAFLRSFLVVAYGGRVAEKLVFNQVTTGASSDIKQATTLARRMVTEWGMSESVGPLFYSDTEEHIFLGREIARNANHGEEVTRQIDAEVRRLITEAEQTAERLLTDHRDKLDLVAQALLEFETLTGEELRPLLDGKMTLDDLRKIKPTSPRQVKTLEDVRREEEELARQRQQQQQRQADAAAATHTTNGAGHESGTAGGAGESGGTHGGLPVPKALRGRDGDGNGDGAGAAER